MTPLLPLRKPGFPTDVVDRVLGYRGAVDRTAYTLSREATIEAGKHVADGALGIFEDGRDERRFPGNSYLDLPYDSSLSASLKDGNTAKR